MARSPRIILAGDGPVNRRQTLTIIEKVIKKHDGAVDFLVPVGSLADSAIPPIAEVVGSYLMTLEDQPDVTMIFATIEGEEAPEEGFVADLRDRAAVVEVKGEGDLTEVVVGYGRADKGDILAVVWEDEDPSLARAVAAANAKEIPVRDLSNGFATIVTAPEEVAEALEERVAEDAAHPERRVPRPERRDTTDAELHMTPEIADAMDRLLEAIVQRVVADAIARLAQ